MIHKTKDGGFVLSAYQVWRPGYFESERAARQAQKLDDAALAALQDAACKTNDGVITKAAVVAALEARPA